MILYLLRQSKLPLRKTEISDCLIELNFTDYLTVQTAIGELTEGAFISADEENGSTKLSITEEGNKALSLFMGSINEGVRTDLQNYLKEHRIELSHSGDLSSNYKRSITGEYEATLIAKDRGSNLMEIILTVPSEEIASNICDHWSKESAEIYDYLTKKLF